MKRGLWILAVAIAMSAAGVRGEETPATPEVSGEPLEGMIRQLADPDLEVREEAARAIRERGEVVISELERAAQETDDPEIRARSLRLIDAIRQDAEYARWKRLGVPPEMWDGIREQYENEDPAVRAAFLAWLLDEVRPDETETGRPVMLAAGAPRARQFWKSEDKVPSVGRNAAVSLLIHSLIHEPQRQVREAAAMYLKMGRGAVKETVEEGKTDLSLLVPDLKEAYRTEEKEYPVRREEHMKQEQEAAEKKRELREKKQKVRESLLARGVPKTEIHRHPEFREFREADDAWQQLRWMRPYPRILQAQKQILDLLAPESETQE